MKNLMIALGLSTALLSGQLAAHSTNDAYYRAKPLSPQRLIIQNRTIGFYPANYRYSGIIDPYQRQHKRYEKHKKHHQAHRRQRQEQRDRHQHHNRHSLRDSYLKNNRHSHNDREREKNRHQVDRNRHRVNNYYTYSY